MEQKAETTVQLEVPEITQMQFERDLANKKEELARAELVTKEHEHILVEFEKLLPLLEGVEDKLATPEMCKILKPVYAYEETEEYSKLIAQQERIKYIQSYYQTKDKSIKGLKDTIEAKKKVIADLKEKIAKMEGD